MSGGENGEGTGALMQKIESKKNNILDKLFVKINWSRRVRPKEGDIFGLKLFIVLGIMDTIFAILFLAWMIYSIKLGTGINILSYLLSFVFIVILFRIAYDMYIRNFKGIVGGVIITTIFMYIVYNYLLNPA